ncbi:MAG: hypothetical protein MI785_03515 [Kiloniellales bacterium]|nr:hypothetical protein [Kiloniellales bacterium]
MERATIEAPAAPDLADGEQRRAWLIFEALRRGIGLPEAIDQAELAEAFIVGARPRPKALPAPAAPTLTERAEDLVAESERVKGRSAAVLREAEGPSRGSPPAGVSQETLDKVLVAIAAYGPKVGNRKLIEDSGTSHETVRRAILRLRQLGRVRQDGKGAGRQLHVVAQDEPGSDEPEESDPVPAANAPDPASNVVRLPAPTARPAQKEAYGAVSYLRFLRPYRPTAGVRFRQCQWIAGEPLRRGCSDHLKCGAPTVEGGPYCGDHLARAYAKPEPGKGLASTSGVITP